MFAMNRAGRAGKSTHRGNELVTCSVATQVADFGTVRVGVKTEEQDDGTHVYTGLIVGTKGK